MKRIISVLLSFAIMLTALCVPAFAEGGTGGSGNIDGGGGSMGNATSHGSWNPGNEGVRITVVRASDHAVVTTPFDLTNKQPAAGIYHFGKVSIGVQGVQTRLKRNVRFESRVAKSRVFRFSTLLERGRWLR